MLYDYLPLLIMIVVVSGFVGMMLIMTHMLGPGRGSEEKLTPYESGMIPLTDARSRFFIKFFLIAMIFIVFDIEVIFLYLWAVVFKNLLPLGIFIFIEMVVFIGILLFGLIFIWKKGALEWE
ncbi:MAG: NADH-quinone oxidoreductase subunit A [Fidelibacterota bacterium]